MKVKDVTLTENPMVNIHMMVPLLDEEGRKAISYLMYGYCLGEMAAGERLKNKAVEGR